MGSGGSTRPGAHVVSIRQHHGYRRAPAAGEDVCCRASLRRHLRSWRNTLCGSGRTGTDTSELRLRHPPAHRYDREVLLGAAQCGVRDRLVGPRIEYGPSQFGLDHSTVLDCSKAHSCGSPRGALDRRSRRNPPPPPRAPAPSTRNRARVARSRGCQRSAVASL